MLGPINSQPIKLDALQTTELGHYVYMLCDPVNRKPFYVGKGGGDGRGNDRVSSHFEEAAQHLMRKDAGDVPEGAQASAKIERILGIWQQGREVSWCIVRSGIPSEAEAFRLEGALIDVLDPHELANKQSGHNGKTEGLKWSLEVESMAAAAFDPHGLPKAARNRTIYIFNIEKGLAERCGHWSKATQDNVFEATRQEWYFAESMRHIDCAAVGLVKGVSLGAFWIDCWNEISAKTQKGKITRKFKFDKAKIDTEVHAALYRRNFQNIIQVRKFWQWRGVLAIRVGDDGIVHDIYGSPSQASPGGI